MNVVRFGRDGNGDEIVARTGALDRDEAELCAATASSYFHKDHYFIDIVPEGEE